MYRYYSVLFISEVPHRPDKSADTFWTSAKLSIAHPIAHRTILTISRAMPNLGFVPPVARSETAGELRMMRGKDTVQTYDT